ncbi:hypothetical protein CDAR_282651 [Caerostris darwini]|uniref:ATP synthase F0 subunit 8 n=1 Tax=Caerostris darwini TaxID=1538125 RepID=A0AAV4T9F6_9ARAC|nr:hypothetical protein CDAR_282651 [Caerostris darwini]
MKEIIDNIATPISDLLCNTLACCGKIILFFLALWFIAGVRGVKLCESPRTWERRKTQMESPKMSSFISSLKNCF